MRIRRILIPLLIALIITVMTSACQKKAATKSSDKKGHKSISHTLTKAEKKKILAAADRGIDVALAYRSGDSTAALEGVLAGPAARLIKDTADKEAASGRTKKRVYAKRKYKIVQFFQKAAGVSVSFVDQGYVIDNNTSRQLTSPSNKKQRLLLMLRKKGKRWIIYEIFFPKLQPKSGAPAAS